METSRINKIEYYLGIAEAVAKRSTCLRRQYGAVIVNNDSIISTGYNGAPRNRLNCNDVGKCIREVKNIPAGERYELCRSVHAEQNALIEARRSSMEDAVLYLVGLETTTGEYSPHYKPCRICAKMIANSGIKYIISRTGKDTYTTISIDDLMDELDQDLLFITSEK